MLYRLALASSLLLVAGCGSPSSPAAQGGHDVHPGDPPMLRVVDSAIPDDVFRFGMGTSVVGEAVNEGGGSPVVLLEAEVPTAAASGSAGPTSGSATSPPGSTSPSTWSCRSTMRRASPARAGRDAGSWPMNPSAGESAPEAGGPGGGLPRSRVG